MNWNGITMLTVIKKCEPSPYEITGNNGQINKGFVYPVYFDNGEEIASVNVSEEIYNSIDRFDILLATFRYEPATQRFDKNGRLQRERLRITSIVSKMNTMHSENELADILRASIENSAVDVAKKALKDSKKPVECAHSVGAPVPMTAQVQEIMQYLHNNGDGSSDHSAIIHYYEKLADTKL